MAIGFLRLWRPRQPWTLVTEGRAKLPDVRSFTPTTPQEQKAARDWIANRLGRGFGLVFLTGQTERPMHSPISEAHLAGSQHIALSLAGDAREASSRLTGLPRPTTLILTGRGIAAIWSLRAPAPLATVEALGRGLVERTGGTLCWLVPLPGTRRVTGEQVRTLHHAPALTYAADELAVTKTVTAPAMRVRRADSVEARPIDWMWKYMMATGELTIIAGMGSAGKTTMCLSLAAIITTGGTWPDGTKAKRGSALVIEGEDDIGTVTAPRLIAAGADLAQVAIVDAPREMLTAAMLDEAAEGLKDLRMVVLSPLRRLIHDNQSTNTEIRNRLEPLIAWAKQRRVALIGIMHPQKGNRRQSADALAGSPAYTELARLTNLATIDEADDEPEERLKRRKLIAIKTNNAPEGVGFGYRIETAYAGAIETSRVVWLDADGAPAAAVFPGAGKTPAPPPATARSAPPPQSPPVILATAGERWLTAALAGGPAPAATLKARAPAEGVPERSLQRAATKMRIVRYKDGRSMMWRLP